jgi:tetratricopeptide (TPR) repeat protein
MRRFLAFQLPLTALAVAAALCLATLAGIAQEGDSPETQAVEPETQGLEPEKSRTDRLDEYFSALKRESEPASARRIADRIWAEWRRSDSATANQLMAWANEAIRDKRYYTALDLLDQITVLIPDYAEGWNRRATLHYMMNNHAKSMADIHVVLQLEPRHFGALMGMASILTAAGSDEAALGTYLKVLEVYPAMREAQNRVSELTEELAGDEI